MQQKEKTMTNSNEKTKNDINVYNIQTIVRVSKMFAENNMTLQTLLLENTKYKFIKKELDLYDLFELGVTAVVNSKDENVSKTQWYKLNRWNAACFKHWVLKSENIHYK